MIPVERGLPAAAVFCLALVLAGPACESNREPLRPAPPVGPYSAVPNGSVPFRAVASDSDGDRVSYLFDWGDGSRPGWSAWMAPDSAITQQYGWDDTGTFEVRVRIQDWHGAFSEWSDPARITIEEKAPDFSLATVTGDTVRFRPLLASGPVYMIVWDLPCVNSIREVDALQPLYDSLGPHGFTLLAVSADQAKDSSRVRTFAAAKGWRCPVLLDPDRTWKGQYGIVIKPTGILMGMDTAIVYKHLGFKTGDEDTIKAEVLKRMPGPGH
jgi:peroxiredoxin